MPHLLRYRELAVEHYSGIPCALHLWHARQSLNLGFVHSFLTVRRSPGVACPDSVSIGSLSGYDF